MIETANGFDAVQVIKAAQSGASPELVLMDYAMPRMAGLEAARCLRDLAPDLPIVVMTGHADLNAVQTGG